MAKQVSININEFNANVSNIRRSVSNLKNSYRVKGFNRTNTKPFTRDLEYIADALSLLSKYKKVLEADITLLTQTGKGIQDIDRQVSNLSGR
ncbi:type VII secretion effector, SACOL2603 family [Amphibacillus marinus]|uniref:Type VII secretion effector, SACOL2603 family n=1 Tax=Amphibacillus marinus TaxID=872970 RepID=A0A1H8TVH2_9BACI|nr:TIGR04197 family type VII secretion effector [Amphibacillus marinus]SEO94907.1 type VII secretion effector, SACOL2603 family [Amphibacillus marinus]